ADGWRRPGARPAAPRPHPRAARPTRRDRAGHRARHGRRHVDQPARDRHGRGPGDRRRDAGGDPERRARDRSLSRPARSSLVSELVLTAREVFAGYGGEDILHGVSIELRRGTIVAVIGPNGSGKSTLLKPMYGLVPPRKGRVTLFEPAGAAIDLTGLRSHRITALGLNMVPQLANTFPEMSVLENLEIGALPARERFGEQLDRVLAAFP